LQAVALMLGDGAERALFEHCAIRGHQDTLYANRGRAWFRDCRIAGTVDFIFGAARALFERCDIVSLPRPDADGRQGWIAAASTPRAQIYGLTFRRCRLVKAPGVPAHSVGLGRFWRPTTTFPDGRYGDPEAAGACVFIQCWMDDHIIAAGWDEMGYNAKAGARAMLTPAEARPAEFASRGPGAAPRAFQLSAHEAALFTPERIMDGWRGR
jgi:pectinesterase